MILLHSYGKKVAGLLLAMGLLFLLAIPLHAVIIKTPGTDNKNGTTAPTDDSAVCWDAVGVAGSSLVYIGNGYALTAAHVAANIHSGTSINFNNLWYSVDQDPIRLHESLISPNPIDLSLVHLGSLPSGLASFPISSAKPITGSSVMGIGFGFDQQTSITYWDANWNEVTQSNSVHSGFKLSTPTQIKRWGTNNVTSDVYTNPVDAGFGNTYEFNTTFNSTQGGSEFQAVEHDSGGGLFYKDNGVWNLAGIIDLVDNRLPGQPANTALFRDSTTVATGNTLSVDVSKYRDQIVAQVQTFQVLGTIANPTAYMGSGWTKVQLVGNTSFGSSTGTWSLPIDTNGFNFTVDTSSPVTLNGVISSSTGTGGLIKNGTGTLTLTAQNTYTGNTTVLGGLLNVGDIHTLDATVTVYGADAVLNATSIEAGTLSVGYPPPPNAFAPSFSLQEVAPIPEPGSLAMLLSIAGIGLIFWRRSRR